MLVTQCGGPPNRGDNPLNRPGCAPWSESLVPKCSLYDICNREVEVNRGEGLCILHSKEQTKDEIAFADALEKHRKERGDNFAYMMFPKKADFSGAKFTEKADFRGVGFSQGAFFSEATFTQGADFRGAIFTLVDFLEATFDEGADFSRARFCEKAFFINARFVKEAIFDGTIFMEEVSFGGATFLGKTLLASGQTRLHIGSRIGVYDEVAPFQSGESRPWLRIEQFYRGLKQNYEDRHDYERAGDFHYGEKEMRRQNPQTRCSLRCLLMLYWQVSGYGERMLRPLLWALGLFAACTFFYLWCGLRPAKEDYVSGLTLRNVW